MNTRYLSPLLLPPFSLLPLLLLPMLLLWLMLLLILLLLLLLLFLLLLLSMPPLLLNPHPLQVPRRVGAAGASCDRSCASDGEGKESGGRRRSPRC